MQFFSDNTATVCPELMAAIAACNTGPASAYGNDAYTMRLETVLSSWFETPVKTFVTSTGTAANALALATLCPGWGTVLCHTEAHIERDECGAPEFYSGAKLTVLDGIHAKITPATLDTRLKMFVPSVHQVKPHVLSLTQATERGTVYTLDELKALTAVAQTHGLKTHMDGARFANALVSLKASPADMTWRAGIDVLSLGATKNGGFGAEAVVFFNPGDTADFEYRRKRAGHLLCKSRYIAAQLTAYVETAVWQRNAQRANQLATRIAQSAAPYLAAPVEANSLFLTLAPEDKAALQNAGVGFYDWKGESADEIRLVVSWDQPETHVDQLCALLESL